MDETYIPAKTVAELSAPHPPGTRHAAMFKIAFPLLGNGLPKEAVFATLRQKFPDPDKTDKEIHDVIQWVMDHHPTPSGYGAQSNGNGRSRHFVPLERRFVPVTPPEPPQSPQELTKALINGASVLEADWAERSPIRVWDAENHAALLMEHLYGPAEFVNVVTEYTVAKTKDGSEKANPQGSGKIMTRDQWLERFSTGPAPRSKAGAWVRPNPTKESGTGKEGAIKDCDVASHRFLLLESDLLSIDEQLSVYARLPLPVAALICSGGDSIHAWLKIDARDDAQYEVITERIYSVMEPLGFDRSNKNPSRLSRLPGVKRTIGARGEGQQYLIFLDPDPKPLNLDLLEAIARPTPGLILGSFMGPRMKEFIKPKPKPFTLEFFEGQDKRAFMDGFYFRESEVTLWSGVSGHGKSTMLGTVMCHLMAEKTPIFICSLEHRLESLCVMNVRIALGHDPSDDNIDKFTRLFGPLYSAADLVGSIKPERLLDMMRGANAKHGAKHFFIDSLMRIEGLEEEYPLQGAFLTALTKVAMDTFGHVHLVAHPRKLDEKMRVGKMDVKGSIALSQGAFNMVAMRRNLEKDEMKEKGATAYELSKVYDAEFVVEKQNASGWRGAFRLSFDPYTRQFKRFNPTDAKPPIVIDDEG